ncbi:hypothetical protein EON65_40275 [archaeon]|nr:MAG: hypothetical protein EON65_40275 [archaeon]
MNNIIVVRLFTLVIAFLVTVLKAIDSNGLGHHNHSSVHLRQNYYHGMELYELENAIQEKTALKKLMDAIADLDAGKNLPGDHPFVDVIPSIIMESNLVPPRDKFIVGERAIRLMGKDYIVYAAGIANEPAFEGYMRWVLGADVYAFDCTTAGKASWNLNFHQWCLGTNKKLDLSKYASTVAGQQLQFYTLPELKKKLGHTRVDMLKMDIEGCEWDLLYDEVIRGQDEDLPVQLLFELHTEGANWKWVPEDIVKGKKRRQVNQLIVDLYHRNYRVFHVELNDGDRFCAEIGFYRVANKNPLHERR